MYEVLFLSEFQYDAQGEVVYIAYGKSAYYHVHKHDGYRRMCRRTVAYREGGGLRCSTPPEIPKTPQNRAKLNPICENW